MNEDLAPIILFIYNRPEHTKKTLLALHENVHADNSILYIFADGPKESASDKDIKLIAQTREVVQEKKWCKDVILVSREKNMNLEDNVIDGITTVIHKHGKAIILEDDLITSPYFLTYCNEGLTMYKHIQHVFSINAFMYDIDYETEATTFLCPLATNPWGWATWADRWSQFESSPEYVDEVEKSVLLKNRFNFGTINWFAMLKHLNSWYDRWYYTAFARNGLGIFPTKPLIQNIGFDNSGTHLGYSTPQQELYLSPIPLVYQSSINMKHYATFLNHFKMKRSSRLRRLIHEIKKTINYKNYNIWWN